MDGLGVELIDRIIKKLEDYAGPMSKFIIMKQIKSMDETPQTIPKSKLPALIDKAVSLSLYNPVMKERAKKELLDIVSETVNGGATASAPAMGEEEKKGVEVLFS
ncbi:MAG: hypothetical protein QCI38_05270 [Candidatus Thermoplasmatota archaeon]|nr:hypothetical protein [Candidatus Thermoplasmatota archaeon]